MREKGFAPILIILVVLLAIGGAYYFGTQKNNILPTLTQSSAPVATGTPTEMVPTTSPIATPDPTADWKTYVETREVKFTLKYPPNWTLNTKDAMYGEKRASFDSGKEKIGSVNIQWNAQPVEPECKAEGEIKESVQIKGRTIEMCHFIGSSQEPEGYFYNSVQDRVNYSIVTSNYPGEENRKFILKILSTLQI